MSFAVILMANTTLPLAVTGSTFCYYSHMYNTPTFKTKDLCLVSNVEQIKQLLLLYKQLMQHYSLLQL